MSDKLSYLPEESIQDKMARLYAEGALGYKPPTRPACGPHPQVDGTLVPGGCHTFKGHGKPSYMQRGV